MLTILHFDEFKVEHSGTPPLCLMLARPLRLFIFSLQSQNLLPHVHETIYLELFRYLRFQSGIDLRFGTGGVGRERSQDTSRRQGCSRVGGEGFRQKFSSRVGLVVDGSNLCAGSNRSGLRWGKSADIGGCHEGDERGTQDGGLHDCLVETKNIVQSVAVSGTVVMVDVFFR